MIRRCNENQIGLFSVLTSKGGVLLQSLLILMIIAAGIRLELNIVQWIIVALTSAAFLFISFYRSATMLVLNHDQSISSGQAVRIRAMSNLIMAFAAGFTLFAQMLVFLPNINQFL